MVRSKIMKTVNFLKGIISSPILVDSLLVVAFILGVLYVVAVAIIVITNILKGG